MTSRLRIWARRVLVLGLLLGTSPAHAQVSPGPLAAPHAALDGSTRCLQCHVTGGQKAGMDARCLACHGEIAWLRTQQRGPHAAVAAKACAGCHPDHGGRDFQMIAWDGGRPEAFDHRRSGFALEGRHAAVACRTCHAPAFQKSPVTARLRRRDASRSWLGLERACASCHEDVHRGQLGADCRRCHDAQAWKPARGFDHARTAYPLTGAHATLACTTCHTVQPGVTTAAGKPVLRWAPVPHADCTPCHRDPHAGRFPGACAKCHGDTGSFLHTRTGGFSHDLTRYPLRGRHAQVACAKCHDPRTAGGAHPAFARCGDCHRDAHAGLATLAGRSADCSECHDVNGFGVSTYTRERHQSSAYPLVGAHGAVACRECHARRTDDAATRAALGASLVEMRPRHAACGECHHDPHRGRFATATDRMRARACLDCHAMTGFHPGTFDVAAHQRSSFPLEGAHRATPCQACHHELEGPPATHSRLADAATMRTLTFENPARRCAECHRDPHDGQFAHRADHGACEGCHDAERFEGASRFVHDRDSAFRLEGRHATVACASCHPAQARPGGGTRVRYRGTPSRCEDCHDHADGTHTLGSTPGIQREARHG